MLHISFTIKANFGWDILVEIKFYFNHNTNQECDIHLKQVTEILIMYLCMYFKMSLNNSGDLNFQKIRKF